MLRLNHFENYTLRGKTVGKQRTEKNNLYCCTVHLVDSLIITQPTNALIVCHLFLNHFLKTLSLLIHVSIAYRLYVLPDDDKRYAIETCRSSESVLKK